MTEMLVDSYSESNYDTYWELEDAAGYILEIGQSFTGDGGVLDSAVFYLKRSHVDVTGNATAKIYTHSGTFGTSSLPTGAALATSDNVDVTIISTDEFELITFNFTGDDKITLTNTTKYVVTVEYNDSATQSLQVGIDGISPTHGGNLSYYDRIDTAWYSESTQDLCFYVYREIPGSFALSGNGVLAFTGVACVNPVYKYGTKTDFSQISKSTNIQIKNKLNYANLAAGRDRKFGVKRDPFHFKNR